MTTKQNKHLGRISTHLFAFFFSIALVVWSKQSPRVLLYAFIFGILFRMLTIWIFSLSVESSGQKGWLIQHTTREPEKWERSKPYRDEQTRKPVGLGSYIGGIIAIFVMLGVLLVPLSGTKILSLQVMLPEMCWALVIAFIYLADDLISRQLIVSTVKPVAINLGYNVSGLNFMLAAIFLCAIILLFAMNIAAWFTGGRVSRVDYLMEWMILIVLTALRFIYDFLRDIKKDRGSFSKLPH